MRRLLARESGRRRSNATGRKKIKRCATAPGSTPLWTKLCPKVVGKSEGISWRTPDFTPARKERVRIRCGPLTTLHQDFSPFLPPAPYFLVSSPLVLLARNFRPVLTPRTVHLSYLRSRLPQGLQHQQATSSKTVPRLSLTSRPFPSQPAIVHCTPFPLQHPLLALSSVPAHSSLQVSFSSGEQIHFLLIQINLRLGQEF